MKHPEQFGSRIGMLLTMLGMAVGTGNIWRFPRVAASNGGGEFVLAWVVFLFLWSIPLILLEFGMGRRVRSGPIRGFIRMMGPGFAWMGGFIAVAAAGITFYYSVVTGWTFRYAVAALIGEVPEELAGALWFSYTESWWPVLTHAVAIGCAIYVVGHGVRTIEKVAKVLMPSLIVLVIILAIRAVTLPNASAGLSFLFTVDWPALGRAELWIQALTQNAWDTGAGWGLVLCYAAYLREKEDTVLNAFAVPTANNVISLLAGIMVLCTVFSVVPTLAENLASNPEALKAYPELAAAVEEGRELTSDVVQTAVLGSGNEGLTFIWIPQLFSTLPGSQLFTILFFVALAAAAFTSLVALTELATRVLVDSGVHRRVAVRIVGVTAFVLGFPSAIYMPFFRNQDWVWSMALMVAGLFFSIAVVKSGVGEFRRTCLNHADSDIHVGRWWEVMIRFVVPAEAVVLVVWWLYQAVGTDPRRGLNPFAAESTGTVLLQFGVALAILIPANRWLVKRNT